MKTNDPKLSVNDALEADILGQLLEQQPPAEILPGVKLRMRGSILAMVAQEEACLHPGFKTIRAQDGEWLEPVPGAQIKILHQDGETGPLTYLARLAPGFEMHGHPHPVDEECMMLEGDLWLGDLHLQAGDYHFASSGMHHGRLRSENGALVYLKGALPA